jgi:hypothetical protein
MLIAMRDDSGHHEPKTGFNSGIFTRVALQEIGFYGVSINP